MSDPMSPSTLGICRLRRRTVMRLKSWAAQDSLQPKLLINDQVLPGDVGQTVPGELRFLCVGPGEWLVVSDVVMALEQRARLEHETAEQCLALVELSGGIAALKIQGPNCREVLAKGCGVDFHPRAFPEGACARTLLVQLSVTLDCRGPQEFDLYVGRSYLRHLQSWLADAFAEYNLVTGGTLGKDSDGRSITGQGIGVPAS
jgi:heterotetrameric sarcosine oxidase gamma subunit